MIQFTDNKNTGFPWMDGHYFFPVLVITSFLIFTPLLIRKWKSKTRKNLPPGPWKLPLIGNIHQLVGRIPHRCLAELAKKHGPVMHLQLGEASNIVISSAQAAKEVMKTHDITFAYRPYLLLSTIISYDSSMVFSPYGDYWRQMRKICVLELLSMKRVQSYRSIREEEVSKLVRLISAGSGSVINLTRMLYSSINCVASRAAFDKIFEGQEAFIPLVKEIVEIAGGLNIADLFPSIKLLQLISGLRGKLERLHRRLDEILENVINEHKARKEAETAVKKPSDLIDVLLDLQDHGDLEFPLTTDNIKGVILDVFVAGSETSASIIEWTLTEMLRNPRVMEKAQAEVRQVFGKKARVDESSLQELTYLKLVIKESMRLHPPVPLLVPRECQEKCLVNGYEIPAKATVHVNVWLIGRDPSYWTEPERFWPERFHGSSIDYKGGNFEFIPFGAGRRICPGMLFGMANVELPLANLLFHFDWKLPSGVTPENLDMSEAFGLAVRRRNNLCLIPTIYNTEI